MIHFFVSKEEFFSKLSRDPLHNELCSKDAAGCLPLYPLTPRMFLSKGCVGERDRHMHSVWFFCPLNWRD